MVATFLPGTLAPARPDWLTIADGYLGVTEIPGPQSNAVILQWARDAGGFIRSFFTNDDIAWCALFANACLEKAGIAGTHSLAAASFVTWGVELAAPALGAILTFTRPGGNHVGFYLGETATHYLVRGGNQHDSVRDTWLLKARNTAIRWPAGRPLPEGNSRIALTSTGEESNGRLD